MPGEPDWEYWDGSIDLPFFGGDSPKSRVGSRCCLEGNQALSSRKRRTLLIEVYCVLDTTIELKKKRDLKAKRDQLFEQYLKHPMDTRLALEIKSIDDQVAKDAEQTRRKPGSSNKILPQ
jgi:hypothetical protein